MRRPLAVIAAALLGAGCVKQRELEPNGHFTGATPVQANAAVRGTISTPGDVDWYVLDAAADGVLSLHVGGIRGVDFVVSVQDRERVELKRCDETASGGDEEALDIGVRPGRYYVVLSNKNEKADNPAQKYVLRLRVESPEGRELEPNDRMLFAQPLVPGGVLRGHYHPTRNLLSEESDQPEEDWFRIELATGQFILNANLSEVPKVDPVLDVYDANAYRLKEADAGPVGEGEALKGFGLRGPARIYLLLRAKQKNTGSADVHYELLTEMLPYQGETEFEPNDQRLDATPLLRESVAGTLNPKGDIDWYRLIVSTSAGQIFSATVSALPGMDLQLDFAGELGNPIVHVDNAAKEQPETLTGIGVAQGTYYLVLSEKTGKLAEARRPYALAWNLAPFQTGLEYEINDSSRTAQALKVGESIDGYLAPKGDVDWYEFNVYQKGRVVVEIAGIFNVQLAAAIYDQDYKELAAGTARKAGESVTLAPDLDPGTYAARLSGTDSAQNNVRDKYTLRVRAQ